MKIIKKTRITCYRCGDVWRLDKVELSNGDKCLRCFHCDPNLRVWVNCSRVFIEPGDILKHKSIKQQQKMREEILEAIYA